MNCISLKKLTESEYKDCGFYHGAEKLALENAFSFERNSDNSLVVKSFMVNSGGFVVNNGDGIGCYFESTLKHTEFKGVDENGNLVNIENWVLNNAIEINGASEFLGV